MPFIEISQILIVLCFLGVLFAVQMLVRRNREGLRTRLALQRRIQLIETLTVGAGERVHLLSVDGRDCLVHSARHGSSLLIVESRSEDQKCAV